MAATLDEIVAEIARIRAHAKEQFDAEGRVDRPRWPALVLRTPKGWTGPHEVDGKLVEGTWRAHQCRCPRPATIAAHRASSSSGFARTAGGAVRRRGPVIPELRALNPHGTKRMSATPHANGGELLRDLRLPDFTDYAVDVPSPAPAPSAHGCWAHGCAT
jgi:xylulose-5-phosphate/fructose-6-phosphate phosphoketolase